MKTKTSAFLSAIKYVVITSIQISKDRQLMLHDQDKGNDILVSKERICFRLKSAVVRI